MLRISQLIQAKHPPLAYPNVCISRKTCTEIPEIVTTVEPRSGEPWFACEIRTLSQMTTK